MRCEFLQDFNHVVLAPPVDSGDVFNVRQRDIGALELHDISDPRAACTAGGWKVLVSLEFKAACPDLAIYRN